MGCCSKCASTSVTFGDKLPPKGKPLYRESLTIHGQALFVYPYFNFTLLWYTPSAITAVMTSVTQKAFQMPFAPSTRQDAQASGMMTTT